MQSNISKKAGADPGFQDRGGAKIFGVFRVKNHDFTLKNHIFSNFRGGGSGSLSDIYFFRIKYEYFCVISWYVFDKNSSSFA